MTCLSGLLFAHSMTAIAEDENTIIVTANRFAIQESETPFATEIYSASDIQNSGASSLYDFLDQSTSITVLPSYGNPFTQKLDMRGYGIGDGYQNIVVTLNGQRLNNIVMVPQLLSAISISDIDRIEITKGSGSVVAGDGAMAGAIHIYTKDKSGITFGGAIGSHGQLSGNLFAGVIKEKYSLNISADLARQDGYSEADVAGKKDRADNTTYRIQGKYFPGSNLELRLGQNQSTINTIYPGALTQAEFNANPAQNSGNTYTQQQFTDNNTSAGVTYDLSASTKVEFDTHHEKKLSNYITFSSINNYTYSSHDLAVKHTSGGLKAIAGLQIFDGVRIGSSNNTTKLNTAYFAQALFKQARTNYSFGMRTERVDYRYNPNTGTALADGHSLSSYELGINHTYSASLSSFANLQHAYQAPDIDRFFNFGGSFNAFIKPAISDTLNLGLNRKSGDTKTKISLFYASLSNEIYYNAASFKNTNIDKSHKYGLEAQANHQFSTTLSASVNYAYTKAIIDSEDEGAGSFNGKNLPGVSEHTLNLGLKYKLANQASIRLSHSYRNEAYAANDFANNLSQKQPAYNSTNIQYQRKFADTMVFASIDNLFNTPNGIQIKDDNIYPVNFTRTWMIGFKTSI